MQRLFLLQLVLHSVFPALLQSQFVALLCSQPIPVPGPFQINVYANAFFIERAQVILPVPISVDRCLPGPIDRLLQILRGAQKGCPNLSNRNTPPGTPPTDTPAGPVPNARQSTCRIARCTSIGQSVHCSGPVPDTPCSTRSPFCHSFSDSVPGKTFFS